MTREEIAIVPTHDAEVYVEDVGPRDAPVLVVLPGGPGGSSYPYRAAWEEELADYRVVYLDPRGSGRSPELPPEPRLFTVDALVDDLEAVRVWLAVDRWVPVGHGFGALAALEYGRRFPELTPGVVALGPWVHYPELARALWRAAFGPGEPPEDPTQAVEEAFAAAGPKALFDRLSFPSEHGRAHLEWLAEGLPLAGGEGVEAAFRTNGLWELDYGAHLLAYPVDVAVIVGERDGTSYPHQAERLTDLTGGRLEVLSRAGHYPWIDEPEAFFRAFYGAVDVFSE
ncbi:alpha/beta hydrolase [Oceanithermus sp.]|uniref:alpha/beta fold hydrolase n=1 Tax=Oceanithermus sp. TaxID=2268145 RepID=UPI0025EF8FCF|nr:alpha/beta hydrolase [Oceanithermus sp.]